VSWLARRELKGRREKKPKGIDYGFMLRRSAAESKEKHRILKITSCHCGNSARMNDIQPSIESKASTHCSRLAVHFLVTGGTHG
jgi:hypothetical protein